MIRINLCTVNIFFRWILFISLCCLSSNCEEIFNNEVDTAGNRVTYKIYNRNNKNGTVFKDGDGYTLFIEGLPLVVVTHGWKSAADTPSVLQIVDGYQEYFDFNIVTVDWEGIASGLYIRASYATEKVGKAVGELTLRLYRENLCTLNGTHLIGHSLGAHVMGVAGYQIQEATGEKVGRITGLDAAGPLFEYVTLNKATMLDPNDAVFVDVIHSDLIFGSIESLGDADFFPNGGLPPQPGCDLTDFWCSHKRSFEFYAYSIGNRNSFISVKCSTYKAFLLNACAGNTQAHMGHWADWRTRGKFYLTTSGSDSN